MTSKRVFWITALLHCAATLIGVLLMMGSAMALLDSGHRRAPASLQVLSGVQFVLVWPMLYPLARLALSLGYSDPLSPVYWLMPAVNSGAVGLLAAGVHRGLQRRSAGRNIGRPQ